MLGDAFRCLGDIESARRIAENTPELLGNIARNAYEEVGHAL